MAGKVVNYDCTLMGSFSMDSCWKSLRKGLQKEIECQTCDDELFAFQECETQTATYHDQGTQVLKVRKSPLFHYNPLLY